MAREGRPIARRRVRAATVTTIVALLMGLFPLTATPAKAESPLKKFVKWLGEHGGGSIKIKIGTVPQGTGHDSDMGGPGSMVDPAGRDVGVTGATIKFGHDVGGSTKPTQCAAAALLALLGGNPGFIKIANCEIKDIVGGPKGPGGTGQPHGPGGGGATPGGGVGNTGGKAGGHGKSQGDDGKKGPGGEDNTGSGTGGSGRGNRGDVGPDQGGSGDFLEPGECEITVQESDFSVEVCKDPDSDPVPDGDPKPGVKDYVRLIEQLLQQGLAQVPGDQPEWAGGPDGWGSGGPNDGPWIGLDLGSLLNGVGGAGRDRSERGEGADDGGSGNDPRNFDLTGMQITAVGRDWDPAEGDWGPSDCWVCQPGNQVFVTLEVSPSVEMVPVPAGGG